MLFHLSVERIKGNTFYPRIPQSRAQNEDDQIKRVCFARNINGCINAMPNGIAVVQNLIALEKRIWIPAIMHLYYIEENAIEPGNLIDSYTLVTQRLVPDAMLTGEIWALQKIQCHHEVIRLMDIKTQNIECGSKTHKIVKDCIIESEITNYDREFCFKFIDLRDFCFFRSYIDKTECSILKEYIDNRKVCFKIWVKIPAGINARGIWEKTWSLFWNRLYQKYKEETQKKKFFPKRLVLAYLDLETESV